MLEVKSDSTPPSLLCLLVHGWMSDLMEGFPALLCLWYAERGRVGRGTWK